MPKKPIRSNEVKKAGRPLGLDYLALRRLSLGYGPSDREHFEKLGPTLKKKYDQFIDQQLNPDSIKDQDCDERINKQSLTCLAKKPEELWKEHHLKPTELKEKIEKSMDGAMKSGDQNMTLNDINKLKTQPAREIESMTWLRAVYSKRQLFEIMVGFWHDHFSVYAFDENISPGFVSFDRDVIRKHALGNFRDLLGAVAQSPAMIFYLDNFVNQSGNANENYARELLELHTLGAENYLGTMPRTAVRGYSKKSPAGYVDGDVYEAARCFTGWRVNTGKDSKEDGSFLYYEPWHDRFQKIVLGHPISEYQKPMKDGHDVLDILCSHQGTANFLAKKLCFRFYGANPPPALVDKTARAFKKNAKSPRQIALTIQALVSAKEFTETSQKKFLRPFEFTASILRGLSAEFTPSENFINLTAKTGQRLFNWRTPDGYPDHAEKWDNTGSVIETWRLCHQMLLGKIEGIKVPEPPRSSGLNPESLVASWYQNFIGTTLIESELSAVTSFLAQGRNPQSPIPEELFKTRYPSALALVLMTPSVRWA